MADSEASRIAVLVPTYNNARTVGDVLEGCLERCGDVLLVDDGSTDDTPDVVKRFEGRVQVLREEVNRGKGAALRRGFEHLRGEGFTHAISIDADGQHTAADIPRFVEAIRVAPDALHVGERDMRAAGAPRRSLFGLWFSNRALRWLAGARLRDSQAGFRAYPLRQLEGIELRGCRYDLELEVLILAARNGIALRAVPIQCSYDPAGGRVSHFRPLRDFLQIGWQVVRLLGRGRGRRDS